MIICATTVSRGNLCLANIEEFRSVESEACGRSPFASIGEPFLRADALVKRSESKKHPRVKSI